MSPRNLESLTEISFNRWMDKQTLVYPYNGIFHSNKKKWVVKPQKDMQGNWDTHWWIKSVWKNTLYDFNSMIFLGEKQNDRESKNIHGHQELGKRGCWTDEAWESFWAGETSLYDTMIHDTRYLQTYWTLRHNFNVCKYLKNHFRKWGNPEWNAECE